ncbi:MAG: ATP synthase F0 subunit A [Candidatus Woykebacteria bacterium RIFCSPHIGHO2_12_FULL_45_10]|uniref:ATP synthase subunit a n=1 Tax=Candidatus Woykebacteria bacterium RIFCSPHIGHO2_12_FULL_45_10 TaxID=1802603 RepID=A0A1G1WP17_9BACT|nr:MAG: ATP synthase F0 subunit A [Candidatus Woykebacteria bacterium RIFCSPHIGHO2_12_FULL_45_10]
MKIEFAAEKLFNIGSLPITNALLTTLVVSTLIITFALLATRKMKKVPGDLQNFAETLVEGLLNLIEPLAGEKTRRFFPFIATFFIFIITANYFGLLPITSGFGLVRAFNGQETIVPLFRSINSDLNSTLALALISVGVTHYFSVTTLGLVGYLKRYLSLNPIYLFVGFLEIISEFTKIISLSFRLFGNIFAGETLLTTVSSLFAFVIPLPFMFLELLVGFVQATVFMMLTLVFMIILTEKHEAH